MVQILQAETITLQDLIALYGLHLGNELYSVLRVLKRLSQITS
jgi:hypothetical protein